VQRVKTRVHMHRREYHKQDTDVLVQNQQRAIKAIKGLQHLTYKERLGRLG